MFSNLTQGAQMWVLEKGDKLSLRNGSVTAVTQPVPRYNVQTPNVALGLQPEMVRDIKVDVEGETFDLKQVPCNSAVERRGQCVFATSREAMLAEVDAMRVGAQQVLDSVEYNQRVLEATDGMLKSLNPNYAKERERDEAIEQLRDDMGGLSNRLDEITNLLTRALNKANTTK